MKFFLYFFLLWVPWSLPTQLWAAPKQVLCTPRALQSIRTDPKFQFQCPPNPEFSWAEHRKQDPAWQMAIQRFEAEWVKKATPQWWEIPLAELRACRVLGWDSENQRFRKNITPRALTEGEQEDLEWLEYLEGDGPARIIVDPDPCLPTSNAWARNVFLLIKGESGSFIEQVFDGMTSRADRAFSVYWIPLKDMALAAVEWWSGGMFSVAGTNYFWLDPKEKAIRPYPLFPNQKGTSNAISSVAPPTIQDFMVKKFYGGDEMKAMADEDHDHGFYRIHPIAEQGRWLPYFYQYQSDSNDEFKVSAFRRQGDHFIEWGTEGYRESPQSEAEQASCLREFFELQERYPVCELKFSCEGNLLLAFLNFQHRQWSRVSSYLIQAMTKCKLSS